MCDPACQTHQEGFFSFLFLTTFLVKCKNCRETQKQCGQAQLEKLVFRICLIWSVFSLLFIYDITVSPCHTGPCFFFPQNQGWQLYVVPMWAAHSVNLWSYFLFFSATLGWAPQLFLIYSTHNCVLFTILYLCCWLFLFKQELCSYWNFPPLFFFSGQLHHSRSSWFFKTCFHIPTCLQFPSVSC